MAGQPRRQFAHMCAGGGRCTCVGASASARVYLMHARTHARTRHSCRPGPQSLMSSLVTCRTRWMEGRATSCTHRWAWGGRGLPALHTGDAGVLHPRAPRLQCGSCMAAAPAWCVLASCACSQGLLGGGRDAQATLHSMHALGGGCVADSTCPAGRRSSTPRLSGKSSPPVACLSRSPGPRASCRAKR